MREVAFIKQNKEKWLNFEQAIFGKTLKNPDELASLYIHLVNDLSYAQTYYPKSKTILYLNNLAAKAFQKIYKTKREDTNRFVHFFKVEVPMIIYEYRRYVLYAFIIFLSFVAIGALSAANDASFVRLILGDSYVNMSLENIEAGDPVAVYKSGSNWGSFIGITLNNLYVGIKAFIFGIFVGLGTAMIMLYNGIMIGAFQYFFYKEGVLWESVRGIWIHGAMEIFAIVIEGAAGLILGASILFPKTYSRLTSFKMGVKNGVKILISTFPFTIAAGFLEGYVTRYSNSMPNWLSVGIIVITLSLISFYYLIYPFILNAKLKQTYAII
ncbi:stage II sporulation protein M [Subsaximicrobium wynnwilliamsii]|uniref:Stage II sporulation protein M n=1 Tax=Subsaximicrobium wynnwilliamsii TaxID=291179 RepID=A0A5C6ZEN3_9FLAO|nr:stage II sporulation protein M [Subsaximicrobium wynnwilliamsii]TXD81951.1 stage II sporulation protein M [Subsaximicrobium wynnwilliamsii]TXD87649.1 stage II sporulation protein M [Subsaximicrobium wynnwilliamsii]TXE01396.1 stage II sporulation protein M [Subsaximicrobium wynnwilliamsii]